MSNTAKLLWVDLEMTGLDPDKDRIMEIGAIATDWDFNEIARFESVVKVNSDIVKDRMVGEFWDKNATVRDELISQNLEKGKDSNDVEKDLVKFIDKHFSSDDPVYLAGNSIHQDRRFITNEWRQADAKLHYRMLDVSAWKIVFSNKLNVSFNKPEAHRAIADIEGSINELKYYLRRIKKT